MKQSDKQSFDILPKKDANFYQNLEQKAKSKLPDDLWLPSLPEVDQVTKSRVERMEESNVKSSRLLSLELTDRPSS